MISFSLRQNGLSFKFAPTGSRGSVRRESDVKNSSVILNEQDLADIYPHLPIAILNAQIAQFAHKELGLWIVEGEGAIETVTQHKGSNNDPTCCDSYTWRFKIAKMLGSRKVALRSSDGQSSITIFDNFIHAPKRDEVERDMKVFKKFV